ncbi:hypothetical protein Tco_0260699 [Tanacetum coccineum]
MNMLNRNCKMSFAKPEFLKKAQRANPRLYDIGCYNDNLALMLAPDSDETIRLEKERRLKLSDFLLKRFGKLMHNKFDMSMMGELKFFLGIQICYPMYLIHYTSMFYTKMLEKTWEKCEHLEKELSKSRTMSKSFEALQKHAINLELDLQQWHLFLSSRVPEACLEWHQKCSGVKTGDSASVVKPIRDRVKNENFTSLRTRLLFVLAEANVVSVNSYTVSGSKGHVMTANDKGHVSFAKLVVSEPSRKSVNFLTLITLARNGADVVVSLESIRAVSKQTSKDSLDAMLENGPWFIRNNPLILKSGIQIEYGLSSIATKFGALLMIDSYKSNTCMQSCGRSSYARAMIKLQTHVELKYTIVVAMLKLIGEGFHMCTIRVEY